MKISLSNAEINDSIRLYLATVYGITLEKSSYISFRNDMDETVPLLSATCWVDERTVELRENREISTSIKLPGN